MTWKRLLGGDPPTSFVFEDQAQQPLSQLL